jgi:hypothetical protein
MLRLSYILEEVQQHIHVELYHIMADPFCAVSGLAAPMGNLTL